MCKVLRKEVPQKLFPWKNVGGREYLSEKHIKKFQTQVLQELLQMFLALLPILASVYLYLNDYKIIVTFLALLLGFLIWFWCLLKE